MAHAVPIVTLDFVVPQQRVISSHGKASISLILVSGINELAFDADQVGNLAKRSIGAAMRQSAHAVFGASPQQILRPGCHVVRRLQRPSDDTVSDLHDLFPQS